MPLPALPANNTKRIFVDYTTGRLPHTFTCRVADGVSNAAALGLIQGFLAAVQNTLPSSWAVTGAREQPEGALFTLPIPLGALDGFVGTNGASLVPANEEPREVRWTGRSLVSGRDVSVALYGLIFITPSTFRITPEGLSGNVGEALTALAEASFNGAFVAIDGANVLWNQYANTNFNSYWESEARG